VHISFDQVREGPVRWEETVEVPAESPGDPERVVLSPVRCRGTATFADPSFHVHGDLAWTQKLRCDRCLAAFEEEASTSFDVVLEQVAGGLHEAAPHDERRPRRGRNEDAVEQDPTDGAAEAELHQLEEDDFGVVRVVGDEIDTAPLIAEQVLLALPMKPLCKAECAGLCPTCGVDRNVERCQCAPATDTRWAGLEVWLDKRP
jgi:uncharacterized protein